MTNPGAMPNPSRLITLAAAAAMWNCNSRTIRRRIEDGTLTAYRMGPRLIRVNMDELSELFVPIATTVTADEA